MKYLSRIKNRLLAGFYTAFPSLAVRWAKSQSRDDSTVPWAEARVPLRHAQVALITTGGVHHKEDGAFDMHNPDGDASYRRVLLDTPPEGLTITHDYYNHADARADLNLVLPVDRLRTLEEAGAVGSLHPVAYSFMGHIDGALVRTLREQTAPEVAARLRDAGVDYALLVPA